jgi:epoxyqueuosine reductase
MNITSQNIKSAISTKAKALGFVKAGFAKYEILENESTRLKNWLDDGKQAGMEWIERGFEKRKDIRQIMPDAKSVISLAFNYYTPFEHDETNPKISRYAWGRDYHKILKRKLKEICRCIEETSPNPLLGKEGTKDSFPLTKGEWPKAEGVRIKAYVDDGPVMDKAWAVRAGIGWMGKHTNVINPEYGSWFFLCEIITNIEFDSYDEPIEDLCGSCSLCISACPTGAITEEYSVDSNKCISYQTIENRGDIPGNINLDGWIFGCDVCQDVCPFNSPKYNHVTNEEGFYPTSTLLSPPSKGELGGFNTKSSPNPLLAKGGTFATKAVLEAITEEQFNVMFADSPIKRTKFKGWKRNLKRMKKE